MKEQGSLVPTSPNVETLMGREPTMEERSNHPLISFLGVLRRRFKEKTNPWDRRDPRYSGNDDSDIENKKNDDDDEDEEFLKIDFTSIDDVIEFYKSDDDDEEDDFGRDVAPSRMQDADDCFGQDNKNADEDSIVSSWIDNCHFLLAEQEIRKQTQKRVRFKNTVTDGDVTGDNDDYDCDCDCDDENDNDEVSLASSCCSSSTDNTWHSLDTIEEQEFEEFANRWRRDRGIHGKNTKKSLLGRLLREILIGPLDEDFDPEDEELVPGGVGESVIKRTGRGEHPETSLESTGMKNPCETFFNNFDNNSSPVFPEDLLFSIERQ